jgi:hypothetical protein
MVTFLSEKKVSSEKKFTCEKCDYHTNNKKDYEKHLETKKHKKVTDLSFCPHLKKEYICSCGKIYKHRQNLYIHKKKCTFIEENTEQMDNIKNLDSTKGKHIKNISIVKNDDIDYANVISELKNIIVDQQKQIGELIPKIGSNNIINSNNKQKFNINFFLNEQCKDAITMDNFIANLKITLEDLFLTKNKGITEGITNIITKNMNELSLYDRPLHCTDAKRETIYIKSNVGTGEDSQWEKDNEQKKLKKAIKAATYIQSESLNLYTENNPDWMEKESKQIEYMNMVKNSMDDIYKDNRVNKVIKKVCGNVYYNGED